MCILTHYSCFRLQGASVILKTLELEMQESQGQTVFVATAKLVLVQRMKVFILS